MSTTETTVAQRINDLVGLLDETIEGLKIQLEIAHGRWEGVLIRVLELSSVDLAELRERFSAKRPDTVEEVVALLDEIAR